MNRRYFLKNTGLLWVAHALGGSWWGNVFAASGKANQGLGERALQLYNIHTGETFKGAYWVEGSYNPEALTHLNHLLRDRYTGESIPINRNLLDFLYLLQHKFEVTEPIEVICGYRSPRTNEALRRKGRKVARHSRHITGDAIDIRMPKVPLATLRKEAIAYRAGGVGYYPSSDFVHLDIRETPTAW